MKRVLTAAVLIPSLVYVALWAPWILFYIVAAAVGVLCFLEYDGLVAAHGIPKAGLLGIVFGLLLLLLPRAELTIPILLALFAMAMAMREETLAHALPKAATSILGILYTFGSMRTAVLIRDISPWWVMFAMSINWVGDIAAFYVGRSMGRHRLAPRVSPAKSWEGSIGSVVFTILFALVYFHYLIPDVPPIAVAGFATAGNIAGQVGDLAESAIKRGAGVKDSGTMLPGHGGWLDRLDSSLFAFPVIYALLTLR
jgi:phosphatidate cytidylyltransferase